jgi:hypothetical protein
VSPLQRVSQTGVFVGKGQQHHHDGQPGNQFSLDAIMLRKTG